MMSCIVLDTKIYVGMIVAVVAMILTLIMIVFSDIIIDVDIVVDSVDDVGTNMNINNVRTKFNPDQRNVQQERIVGGILASPGEYPTFVGGTGCGATLIHSDLLLTAANCRFQFNRQYVKIGGIERDGSDSEIIRVDYEIPHPKYRLNDINFHNDIMLVKLQKASVSTLIQPLNTNSSIPLVNDTVVAVGFGSVQEGQPYYGNLRKVRMSIASLASCQSTFSQNGYTIYNDSMICAGVPDYTIDTCHGDSGGPLLTLDGIQVGITSFGIGCATPLFPGVYTRVSHYQNFIREMICGHSTQRPSNCTTPKIRPRCRCRKTQYMCRLWGRCLFRI
jgi:trypsin